MPKSPKNTPSFKGLKVSAPSKTADQQVWYYSSAGALGALRLGLGLGSSGVGAGAIDGSQ